MEAETGFEKRRGVSRVEAKEGFALVHVSGLGEPIMEARLGVLQALSDAQLSIDFLKLTPSGLSCVVAEALAEEARAALEGCCDHFSVRPGRSIVMVHAVNMRDEEGLIAQVVKEALASGARMDHLSDMHDRMLVVVLTEDAASLRQRLEQNLVDASAGGRE